MHFYTVRILILNINTDDLKKSFLRVDSNFYHHFFQLFDMFKNLKKIAER